MFLGHVCPGQQVVDAAVGVAVDKAGQHVGDVGLGLDVVQLAGLDQRSDHGPVLAAAVGAGEQAVLAVEGQGPDGALDGVGIELDAAVVQEAGEALPAAQGVADRLGQLAFLADGLEPGAQPGLQRLNRGPAAVLAR